MAWNKIKTFSEFRLLTESADWDDATKKYIDSFFVSFDEKEQYEPRDLCNYLEVVLVAHINKVPSRDELMEVILSCKDKVAHNHPRLQLLKCVLSQYGINIEDVEK